MFRSGLVYNDSDIVDAKNTDKMKDDKIVSKNRPKETDDEYKESFLAGGLGGGGKTATKTIWKVRLEIGIYE